MAEAVAQLAPGGEDARALVKGERDGPDAALGALAGLVAIGDPDLVLGADGAAQEGEVDAIGRERPARRGEEAPGLDTVALLLRQHGGDLGDRVAAGRPPPPIAPTPPPP